MVKLPSELCKYCTSKHACSGYAKCRKLTRLEASMNIPKKEVYERRYTMNPLVRDKIKLEETLKRAEKSGDSKMATWCENQLKYYAGVK